MRTIKEIVLDLEKRERSKLSPPLEDPHVLEKLKNIYGAPLPAELLEIYNITSGGFLEIDGFDAWLLYSPNQILSAPTELHVDFVGLGKIPLVDCKDNDIICYDIKAKKYHFFNIVDEAAFGDAKNLGLLFEEKLS